VDGEWTSQGERMIREFLSACSIVAVRDEATAIRVAPSLGGIPPVFGDFCLTEALLRDDLRHDSNRRDIAINVSQLPGPWAQAQERYESAVVALATGLIPGVADQRCAMRIFTTGLPEDARAAERVFARIGSSDAQLYLPANLGQLTAMLRTSAAVVATRLHAAVLALAELVPVVGFSAAPKLRDFFATLGIRRYFYGLDEGRRLAGWLAAADYDALFTEQRRALMRAPVWAARAKVRGQIESICGLNSCT
jgi:polysaccharide pyruvyl transferase WcaK-like protein